MSNKRSTDEPIDGVVNPGGAMIAGFAAVFAAFVPVTSYITQENSIVQSAVKTLIGLTIPTSAGVASDRTIPALAALYTFVTFAASGAFSAAGQAMSRKAGLDNNYPRAHTSTLRGLPLRLYSAHYNLLEMFPGFALAAGLAQVLAPNNQQIANLLGLHVLAKVALYYPAYLLNIAPLRSLGHVVATASVVNVCWLLATGAK